LSTKERRRPACERLLQSDALQLRNLLLTKGVYIQDVVVPGDLVNVLTEREIANQEIETYRKQREAEDERIAMEQAKGTADMCFAWRRSRSGRLGSRERLRGSGTRRRSDSPCERSHRAG
jgi:hypothetical protein